MLRTPPRCVAPRVAVFFILTDGDCPRPLTDGKVRYSQVKIGRAVMEVVTLLLMSGPRA